MPDESTAVRPTFSIRVVLATGGKTIAEVGQEHATMLHALEAAEPLGKRLGSMVARNLLADVLPEDYLDSGSDG